MVVDDKIRESTRAPSIPDKADKGRLARLASPCANRNRNHLRIGKLRSGLLRMGAASQTVLTPPLSPTVVSDVHPTRPLTETGKRERKKRNYIALEQVTTPCTDRLACESVPVLHRTGL